MTYESESVATPKPGAYSISLTVKSPKGLHARPSMEVSSMMRERCKGEVYVSRSDNPREWYDAGTISGLMLLQAGYETELRFSFDNPEDANPKFLEDLIWILENDDSV